MTADEIRDSRFAGSKYSIETTLDPKAWAAAKKKAEQEAAQFGGFQEEPDPEAILDSRLDATKFADEELHQRVIAMAKKRFKVWPSRYAGFWVSRKYKELSGQKEK